MEASSTVSATPLTEYSHCSSLETSSSASSSSCSATSDLRELSDAESLADVDGFDPERQGCRFMVPLQSHSGQTVLTCREGDFRLPSIEEVNRQIDLFETERLEFNGMQLKYPTKESTAEWDRRKCLLSLASRLKKMSVTMAESLAFRTSRPIVSVSWRGSELDSQNYELCYQANGLSVWKKDFGNSRVIIRSEFLVPIPPQQYCAYASSIANRQKWDSNVSEARQLEVIEPGIDIAYVSINPIATIYPRDYINMRVIYELKAFGRKQKRRRGIQKRRKQVRQHYYSNPMQYPVKRADEEQVDSAPHGESSSKSSSTMMMNSGDGRVGPHREVDREKEDGCNGMRAQTKVQQTKNEGTLQQDEENNRPEERPHDGNVESRRSIMVEELEGGREQNPHSNPSDGDQPSLPNAGRVDRSSHSRQPYGCNQCHRSWSKGLASRVHVSRLGCYASCSCSIEHPDMPEQAGKVRADVKIATYLAQAIYVPNRERQGGTHEEAQGNLRPTENSISPRESSTVYPEDSFTRQSLLDNRVWSRVYMFTEVDPRGWIPTRLSNYAAARVLPATVDRIVTCMLDHYGIQWRTELVYDPELKTDKECETALEYCFLKFLYATADSENR